MSRLPLVEGVLKYIEENNTYFCMPGHKAGKGFINTREGQIFYDMLLQGDITEVEGVDNLHHPEGIIKKSQELLSEYYGSYRSYFLVNGSTSGNLAMIFAAFEEGDKVIVERNCHRSIFNAIIMRKLNPVYIQNEVHDLYDAPFSIDKEHFFYTIEKYKDAKGIILTYPNYYGISINLAMVIKEAKKYNMKVLVDSAHGAHYGAHPRLPESAVKLGADMVVMSAHKTLPSLTQTAYLHINKEADREKVEFYISAFLSTSPSYMFLCSMDYARFYLQFYGKEHYEKLIKLSDFYKNKINNIYGFHIIEKQDIIHQAYNLKSEDKRDSLFLDLTRYIINVPKGYSGHKLLEYLRDNKIQAEMSDNRNVVLILSPFHGEKDFEKLYKALQHCSLEKLKQEWIDLVSYPSTVQCMLPYEVMNQEKENISLDLAEGRISGTAIVPYPPGIPIIMPGERITKDIIKILQYYKQYVTILGLEDDTVLVVK